MDLLWSMRQTATDHGGEAGIEGLLEYDTELFTPASARLILARLERLLRAARPIPSSPSPTCPCSSKANTNG
ncbi:hypothetical protein SANTM175S_04377 [Streptomyces antimycoticus]